jgi:hypothetical protein
MLVGLQSTVEMTSIDKLCIAVQTSVSVIIVIEPVLDL